MGRKHGYYGYIAGTTTAVMLQPLDNIKMTLIVPPKKLSLSSNCIANVYRACKYIKCEQGFLSFYKGFVINVLKTGLSSSIYFSTLRTIQRLAPQTHITNFLVSATARIASAFLTNPLGVIQARYQLCSKQKWSGSIIKNLNKIYTVEGIAGFFKGCAATCWKQATFAGLYYTLYEKGKYIGLSSVIAGIGAGLISTFITHPFEVIRTNIQVYLNLHKNQKNHQELSIFKHLRNLFNNGRLFSGVAPRLVKKPLANTIAFLLFQSMERNQRRKLNN